MDEKSTKNLLSEREKVKKIHILIIISSIPQIIFGFIYLKIYLNNSENLFLLELALFLLLSLIIFIFSSNKNRNQYLIGLSLSNIFSFSFSIILFTQNKYYPLFIYFISLCIYHYSEFFSVLLYHYESL